MRRIAQAQKLVKKERGVAGTGTSLGVELDAEDRLEPGPDAFVGPVVQVHEPRLPVARKGMLVHRVAVILAGDEAAARRHLLHRLVRAPMTVRELVRLTARGQAKDLVAEADAEDGEVGALEQQPAPAQRARPGPAGPLARCR